jgi:hypothetical protein
MIVVSIENEMQRAIYALNNRAIEYNLKMSLNTTKANTKKGNMRVRIKTVVNDHITEKVNSFLNT